jgi:aspartate-semialdehyde dehydrogenase
MRPVLPESPRIAIAGATGAVGVELLRLLEAESPPFTSLKLLASKRSAGQSLTFRGDRLPVEVLTEEALDDVDLAFFSCGKERSLRFAPAAAERGAVVVDNSSAFRMDPGTPLVVPEVNPESMFDAQGGLRSRIIANPNCSTILLVVVLAPLLRAFGLRRVVVSTYQAASGAGARAMQALLDDTRRWFDGGQGEACQPVFGHPLAFNLVPQIDVFLEDGSTAEERKMIAESRKILGQPSLAVDATCVRVPVLRSHSESVSIETERPVDVAAARELLRAAAGVEVVDDPASRRYPMPVSASGGSKVLVGRLRPSNVFRAGLSFWLCGDQLLKGAALNAVQIVNALRRQAGQEGMR